MNLDRLGQRNKKGNEGIWVSKMIDKERKRTKNRQVGKGRKMGK